MRVRNCICRSIHDFFQENDFLYIQTPIITASDCEGAGEMFRVTTLDLNNRRRKENGIDYNEDFFGSEAFLTVSGQLEAEIGALALSDVYTFSPTFRAENSNTSRHASEFWMIEPEMAFCDNQENMDIAVDFLKFIFRYALEDCADEMAFFGKWIDKSLHQTLEHVINSEFERLPYAEAIKILEKAKEKFEFPVKWGVELQSEHERYLTEKVFKRPTIVYDYPKKIKAFYARTVCRVFNTCIKRQAVRQNGSRIFRCGFGRVVRAINHNIRNKFYCVPASRTFVQSGPLELAERSRF